VLFGVVGERRCFLQTGGGRAFSEEMGGERDGDGYGDGDQQEFKQAAATIGVNGEGGLDPGAWQDGKN